MRARPCSRVRMLVRRCRVQAVRCAFSRGVIHKQLDDQRTRARAQVAGPLGDLEHLRGSLGEGAFLDAGELVPSATIPSLTQPRARSARTMSRHTSRGALVHCARALPGARRAASRAHVADWPCAFAQVWLTDKTPHESMPLALGTHRQCAAAAPTRLRPSPPPARASHSHSQPDPAAGQVLPAGDKQDLGVVLRALHTQPARGRAAEGRPHSRRRQVRAGRAERSGGSGDLAYWCWHWHWHWHRHWHLYCSQRPGAVRTWSVKDT
jgi:hypothetical protein